MSAKFTLLATAAGRALAMAASVRVSLLGTVASGSPENVLVGHVVVTGPAGWTAVMEDDVGGQFKLIGDALYTGAAPTDFETLPNPTPRIRVQWPNRVRKWVSPEIEVSSTATPVLVETYVEPGATTFTWPSDFVALESIECYGGGGAGYTGRVNVGAGGGGAGGNWAAIGVGDTFSALPGDILEVGVSLGGTSSVAGTDTYIKDNTGTIRVKAPNGNNAFESTGGAQHALTDLVGTFKTLGGKGGNGKLGTGGAGAGGGGGCAGPDGQGGWGGSTSFSGGPGGGGANGGTSGGSPTSSTSVWGGRNRLYYGSGATLVTGQAGGAGGGGSSPGLGSIDPIWADGNGPTGAAGAPNGNSNTARANLGYGAGGSGGASGTSTGYAGASGRPGRIVIRYWSGAAPDFSDRIRPGVAGLGAWPLWGTTMAAVGDSGASNYGLKARGHFTNISYDDFTGEYTVKIYAYQTPTQAQFTAAGGGAAGARSGVDRIEIYANGGPAYTVTTYTNDASLGGCPVYTATINAADLRYARLVEFRAIIYPINGVPLVLQGDGYDTPGLYLYGDPTGNSLPKLTRYVDSRDGLDTNDGLTPETAYQTLSYAKSQLTPGGGHRLLLVGDDLDPYNYTYGGASESSYACLRWVTIEGLGETPDAVVFNANGSSNGMNIARTHIKNIHSKTYIGNNGGTVWYDHYKATTKSASSGGWGARYETDCYYDRTPAGGGGGSDKKRINITYIGGFQDGEVYPNGVEADQQVQGGLGINMEFIDFIDAAGAHGDIVVVQTADTKYNMCAWGLTAVDNNEVQNIFGGGGWYDAVIENCIFTQTSSQQLFQRNGSIRNVDIVLNTWNKQGYWNADGYDHPPQLYVDEFHFVGHTGPMAVISARNRISAANAATGVFTQIGHHHAHGSTVGLSGMSGGTWSTLNGGSYKIVKIDEDTFSLTNTSDVPINTTGLGTYTARSGTTTGGVTAPPGVKVIS